MLGAALLAQGRRRRALVGRTRAAVRSFCRQCLCGNRRSEAADGRPIATLDAQIAAIARSHGAAVATRNVPDFADCGIDVIDPWRAKP
jgi:predicted nucleic acid-binding protein